MISKRLIIVCLLVLQVRRLAAECYARFPIDTHVNVYVMNILDNYLCTYSPFKGNGVIPTVKMNDSGVDSVIDATLAKTAIYCALHAGLIQRYSVIR